MTHTDAGTASRNRDLLAQNDEAIGAALAGEERRQRLGVELIPSENYTYPEVLAALGSVFTNKYSEGYPGRRYYGGQEFTDVIERTARTRARKLFGAEHANVQPLSGAPMNAAVYLAMLEPGDTVLGMDLSHGGHLTHGAPVSHMGKLYNWVRYKSDPAPPAASTSTSSATWRSSPARSSSYAATRPIRATTTTPTSRPSPTRSGR